MGGFRSGRRGYATTPTARECYQLNADDLTNHDYASEGPALIWWNGERPETADMAAHLCAATTDGTGRLTVLRVRYRRPAWPIQETEDAHPQTVLNECRVPVTYTDCNFGGSRPWFRCPAETCSRRVRKLYLPPRGERFRCRHCHDLGYRSSRVSHDARKTAVLRYRRAHERLDGTRPSLSASLPEKPPDMHWRTYWDHVTAIQTAYEEWEQAVMTELETLANVAGLDHSTDQC